MRSIMSRGGRAALVLAVLLGTASLASAEDWGTVKGQIIYKKGAKLPDNPAVTVNQDKAVCLAKGKVLRNEWVVDAKSRGVKNVIVWLSDVDAAKSQDAAWTKAIHPKLKEAPKTYVSDQPVCAFVPRVIALRDETVLIFKNSASVPHNVKIDGGSLGPQINTAIPPGKELEVGKIKARVLPTEVACTIHPWMKSWLISFKHPYYAVTDEEGKFEIKNAPPGKYRLQIWHENAGYVQRSKKDRGVIITITGGKDTKVEQQIKADED